MNYNQRWISLNGKKFQPLDQLVLPLNYEEML